MEYEFLSGIHKDNNSYNSLINFHEKYQSDILSRIPFSTAEITGAFNSEEFIDFICINGSKKIYIGKSKIKLEKSLSIDISDNSFRKIGVLADSSGYIEIPSRWGVYNLYRRIAYEKAFRQGINEDNIIRIFGVTKRTLYNLKKELKIL